ncbi:hypothetical protein TrRE_jg362 [Triparma retinervis]|uniref:Amino acid transporter transmembrane domain-containing protein n=1 Tax=Triparma retinervis TaxID=2557542 RepID=A0A9W7E0W8_9STRA|nr:hypothetical protein TrRE_jg362 [Triparma retinervis]
MDALPLLKNDLTPPSTPNSDTRRTSSTSFSAGSNVFTAKASESSTLFQLLCTMCGTGILQLPYTVKQGGWLSLALVVLVGAMANWCGKLLVRSLYLDPTSHRKIEGFPELGEKAYGKVGYAAVQVFHKATLFGVSTIFLVLTAKFLLEGLGGEGEGVLNTTVNFDSSVNWTTVWTLAAAFIVLVPVVSYRTLGENKFLSLAGALATVLAVVVVLAFSVYLNPLTPENANMDDDSYVFSPPSHALLDLKLLPSAFSAIVLSFGGAATFPTIEANMEKPAMFPKVLNKAFATLVALYLVTATAGYYTFGDITGRLVQCTKLFVAFHVTTAYPILMNALVTEVECKVPFFRDPLPRTIER